MNYFLQTYFTAVSTMGPVFQTIQQNMNSLNSTTVNMASQTNQQFNGINSTFDEFGKRMTDWAKGTAVAATWAKVVKEGATATADYEQQLVRLKEYLPSMSEQAFGEYQKVVEQTADKVEVFRGDMAAAFKEIAANPNYAKAVTGMSDIATEAAKLNWVIGGQLNESTNSLVTIMSAYNAAASDAARYTNAMVAGQELGNASAQQTADALKKFAAIASLSHTGIEQSIALTQMLSTSMGVTGADAGMKLVEVFDKLKSSQLAYNNGQFDLIFGLKRVNSMMANMRDDAGRDALIKSIFGENIEAKAAGIKFLQQVNLIDEYTQRITGTESATKKAHAAMNTFYGDYDRMSAMFKNMASGGYGAGVGLGVAKGALVALKESLGTLIPLAELYLGYLAMTYGRTLLVKGVQIAYNSAQAAYNFTLAFSTVINRGWNASLVQTAAGYAGANAALNVLFMTTRSFLLTVAPYIAILGGLYYLYHKGTTASDNLAASQSHLKDGVEQILPPLNAATKAWMKYIEQIKEYNESVRDLNEYNAMAEGISDAYKESYLSGIGSELKNFFSHPMLYQKYSWGGMEAPNKPTAPTDTAGIQQEYLPPEWQTMLNNSNKNETTVNVFVDPITGNSTATTTGTGSVTPKVTSTLYHGY